MEKPGKKGFVKRAKRTNTQTEPARVYRPRTLTLRKVNTNESESRQEIERSAEEHFSRNRERSNQQSTTSERNYRGQEREKRSASGYTPRTGSYSRNQKTDRRSERGEAATRDFSRKRSTARFGRDEHFSNTDEAKGYRPRTFQRRNSGDAVGHSGFAPKGAMAPISRENPDSLIRLNRFIANAGVCSRREADELIQNGLVTVNGKVITELGTKVKRSDEVYYKGKRLKAERPVYILLNKPKDYITTTDDPHAKRTVMDLISGACPERVYPVGRLDRNSTGVLLLTNDGELTTQLTHPSNKKRKIYYVALDKKVKPDDIRRIMEGVELDGERIAVDAIDYTEGSDGTEIGIELHSGQNRVVRRLFDLLGYRVVKLDRVYFAGLTKKGLQRGHWRFLTPKEVNMLKTGRF